MRSEIDETPDALARILANRDAIVEVAEQIKSADPRFVLLAARGTSDHAALYAKYLIEVLWQKPCGLVSPSTTTLYEARPDMSDVLLLSVSQSGGSPDLSEVTKVAAEQGALTVAVTNTPDSPMNRAAKLGIDIHAGPELAVAATKSYTAQLLSLYLLIDAIRGGDGSDAVRIPELARFTLDSTATEVAEAVQRYRFVGRMVTTGRGYSWATAAEGALKLAETSYLTARTYSGADLLHGPVAAVDDQTAVLAVCSAGRGGQAMPEVVNRVRDRGGDVLAVGSATSDVSAHLRIGTPECAEELSPILEILPVQRLALGLSLVRGGDPDNPRGLSKVTKTR
ncbi:SIS domain-containing protein [Pseudonocardiaceae bacterium YIM PH 21723]|nr:SIS domain-containing protein [Pseudonocardiaceae bacterium YIM PH 21723]